MGSDDGRNDDNGDDDKKKRGRRRNAKSEKDRNMFSTTPDVLIRVRSRALAGWLTA